LPSGLRLPCAKRYELGSGRPDAHTNPMPHKGSSPRTLDLFEDTLTAPPPPSDPAAALAKPSELASLSDAQLAKHLGQLIDELQRRMKSGRGGRPELEAAARHSSLSLKRLVPRPTKQDRPSRSSKTSSALQEGSAKRYEPPLRQAWHPTRSPSTSACRLLPSARCRKRPRRLFHRWLDGRAISSSSPTTMQE
jgi:hypothetical protein